VRDFLKRIYEPGYLYGNWLWNRWEWMFSLPYLDEANLARIGLWEADGEIVGLATYETGLGDVWFSLDRRYSCLKQEMIDYAATFLANTDETGKTAVRLNIFAPDTEFAAIARAAGFEPSGEAEKTARFLIPENFPAIKLPAGFSIVSLAEKNDLNKINRVLWRGFNHPGEASASEIPGRIKSQSGPDFNKEITLAVQSPGGDFVSYCGMWYDRGTDYAIVEPVATDPDWRRRGFGRAVVHEGIRRCGAMGAKVAYVGSGQQFYYAIGFIPWLENHWWIKRN
jgi:GNAT superfamily N-acetyltransferase